jgi:hypothetical protein
MNKPVTIITEVKTEKYALRLTSVMGVFLIEATSGSDLETFLKDIGMDSQKRMSLIEDEGNGYAHLELDLHDFSHALWYLARLF